MNNSKLLTACGFLALAVPSSVFAAGYVTDFNSLNTGALLVGQDNWTANGTSSATDFAYVIANGNVNTTPAMTLGFASVADQPVGNTVSVGHAYNEFLAGTTAIFQIALVKSSDTGPSSGRDVFGFRLNAGANSLAIVLTPAIAPTPPAPATLGYLSTWTVGYSVNGGSTIPFVGEFNLVMGDNPDTPETESVSYFEFQIDLAANAVDPSLTDMTVVVGGATTGANALAVNPALNATAFDFFWNTANPGAFGNNYIAVDNLSVVPEPSGILMLGLAGLGFVSRRRRA